MKNIFIFNVGSSDVQLKQPIEFGGKNFKGKIDIKFFRDVTNHLLNNYEKYKELIDIPIIRNTLKNLDRSEKIHEIHLFATNQATNHFSDTIYAAQIIKRILKETKDDKTIWGQVLNELSKKIVIHEVNDIPNDYDLMNHLYRKELQFIEENSEYEKVYISVTGGTQAMNTMLLLNGMKYAKAKGQLVYLNENHTVPDVLKLSSIILLENHVSTITQNISSYEYHEAIQYLQNHENTFSNQAEIYKNLVDLLKYAHYRKSFNFKHAYPCLNEPRKKMIRERQILNRLQQEALDFVDENPDAKVAEYMSELYWNMYILYQKGNFVDVCMRLFRFQEEALRFIAVQMLNVKIDSKGKKIDEQWLNDHQDIVTSLKEIDLNRVVTRYMLERIIQYYIQHEGKNELEEVFNKILLINELAELRNGSFGAHGFKGISEEDIFEKMKKKLKIKQMDELQEALFQLLKDILIGLFGELEQINENIYDRINNIILKEVNKLVEQEI
ncbi:hypothetical protein P9857_07595 [Anoxybacillus geothermalis]|uniref:hypothetical protein n=1 Tax=Geobacillus stearothermophilus TaxID=1422 RepID=UPI002E9B8F32|nr:hypothetical protein [Anoxybacillus geothermalis]